MLRVIWVLLAAMGLLVPSWPIGQTTGVSELEGVWQAEVVEMGGRSAGPFVAGTRLTFAGKKLIYRGWAKPGVDEEFEFVLNQKAIPKEIDLSRKTGFGSNGIYELRGDVLQLALTRVGLPRPKTFVSDASSGIALLRLKRTK